MIKDIQDVISYLKTKTGQISNPILESELYITIYAGKHGKYEQTVLVDSFNIPKLGINFNLNSSLLGIVTPDLSFSTMDLTFLVPAKQLGESNLTPIHEAFFSQFDQTGLLLEKPTSFEIFMHFTVNNSIAPTTYTFLQLTGCRFSYPFPTANPKSTEYSKFQTTISYEEFKII